MKILRQQCPRGPLDDPGVAAFLESPGWGRIVWKCPDCGANFIAEGTAESKHSYAAVRTIFGWSRAA